MIKIILLWSKLLISVDWSNSPGFISSLKNFNSFIFDEIIWFRSENFQSSIRLLGKPFLINLLRFFSLNSISLFESFKFLIITHYQRLLNYIKPDFVHVLINGKIVKSGGSELALDLEKKGYESFN